MPYAVDAAQGAWIKYQAPVRPIKKQPVNPDLWKIPLMYLSCRPVESTSPPKLNMIPPCPVYDMPPINPIPPPLRHRQNLSDSANTTSRKNQRVVSAPPSLPKSSVPSAKRAEARSVIEVEEESDQSSVNDNENDDDDDTSSQTTSEKENSAPRAAQKPSKSTVERNDTHRSQPRQAPSEMEYEYHQVVAPPMRPPRSRYFHQEHNPEPEPLPGSWSYMPPRSQQYRPKQSYFGNDARRTTSHNMSSSWANATKPLDLG